MDSDIAERIAHLYHHRDRDGVSNAAATYDPNIGRYKNTHMISLLNEHRADTKVMIDQLMRGEEINWQPKRGTYLGQSGD